MASPTGTPPGPCCVAISSWPAAETPPTALLTLARATTHRWRRRAFCVLGAMPWVVVVARTGGSTEPHDHHRRGHSEHWQHRAPMAAPCTQAERPRPLHVAVRRRSTLLPHEGARTRQARARAARRGGASQAEALSAARGRVTPVPRAVVLIPLAARNSYLCYTIQYNYIYDSFFC